MSTKLLVLSPLMVHHQVFSQVCWLTWAASCWVHGRFWPVAWAAWWPSEDSIPLLIACPASSTCAYGRHPWQRMQWAQPELPNCWHLRPSRRCTGGSRACGMEEHSFNGQRFMGRRHWQFLCAKFYRGLGGLRLGLQGSGSFWRHSLWQLRWLEVFISRRISGRHRCRVLNFK